MHGQKNIKLSVVCHDYLHHLTERFICLMNSHRKQNNKSPLVRNGISYRPEASQSFYCKNVTCTLTFNTK